MTDLSQGGAFKNFTPPASAPDQFSISDTPGSQSNHPITDPNMYAPGAGGDGTQPTSSGDPNASFTFNDPGTVNQPAATPQDGGGSTFGGIVGGAASAATGGLAGAQAPGAAPGTSVASAVASTGFWGQLGSFAGNWAVRIAIIAAGVVLIAAAAYRMAEKEAT